MGADRELRRSLEDWNQSAIADVLSQNEIRWHFNLPASPHFGGIWERLVQSSVRKPLKSYSMAKWSQTKSWRQHSQKKKLS